jgi:hypothetical protein
MHDPDIWREQQISAEQEEAWVRDQLDRLWSVWADEVPWADASPQETEDSSEEGTGQ